MTIARSKLLDLSRAGWVHCISRCVRRAFLCGGRYEHRKAWVEDRLQYLARCFAVDVAGFAVMSNHLHVVVRFDPQGPQAWTDLEVARRWLSVYPREYLSDGTPVLPSDEVIAAQARDGAWVSRARQRLGELSWFMKALKEPIARRANREDGCRGTFWEGRFTSVALLDQPALIACLAYVDLNPVRAKIADTPEQSAATSVRRRIRARNRFHTARRLRQRAGIEPTEADPRADARTAPSAAIAGGTTAPPGASRMTRQQRQDQERAAALLTRVGLDAHARDAEDGLWLCPLDRCLVGEPLGNHRIRVDDYLTLVDATGRVLKAGKRGAIPADLAPILARLDLSVDAWIATMLSGGQMRGAGLGTLAARTADAARRGVRWVRNHCGLFAATPGTDHRAA